MIHVTLLPPSQTNSLSNYFIGLCLLSLVNASLPDWMIGLNTQLTIQLLHRTLSTQSSEFLITRLDDRTQY